MVDDFVVSSNCSLVKGQINKKTKGLFLILEAGRIIHLNSGLIFDRGPEIKNSFPLAQGEFLRVVYYKEKKKPKKIG